MHIKTLIYLSILMIFMNKSSLANESGLPQLNFETYPSLIFWSILSLIILYVLMSKLVTPKVSEILNHREQNIQNNLLKAKSLKEEADIIINKIRDEQENARIEARKKIENSITSNKELMDKKTDEVSKIINKKIDNAIDGINQEKTKKITELLDNSSDVTEKIINKVIDLKVDKKKLNKLVKETSLLITKENNYGN